MEYVGDWAFEVDAGERLNRLRSVSDGESAGDGIVPRVSELNVRLRGELAIAAVGFGDPARMPDNQPLALFDQAVCLSVPDVDAVVPEVRWEAADAAERAIPLHTEWESLEVL